MSKIGSQTRQYIEIPCSAGEKYRVITNGYKNSYYSIILCKGENGHTVVDYQYNDFTDTPTKLDVIITIPENVNNLFINNYSNGTSKAYVYKLLFDDIKQQIADNSDNINAVNNKIGKYFNEVPLTIYNYCIDAEIGSTKTVFNSTNWYTAECVVAENIIYAVDLRSYSDAHYSIIFFNENNICIDRQIIQNNGIVKLLNKHIVNIPNGCSYFYINSHTIQPKLFTVVDLFIPQNKINTRINILSVNCAQFEYPDRLKNQDDIELYKNNWRRMLAYSEFDLAFLIDYRKHFDHANNLNTIDILFDDTINGIGLGSDTAGDDIAFNKTINEFYFLGTIDVGGIQQTVWRRTVYKYKYVVNGYEIYLYCGHYQPTPPYGEDRQLQFYNVIQDVFNNNYEYVIICGDFNVQTDISEYNIFLENNFTICNGGYLGSFITIRDIYADNIIFSKNIKLVNFEVLSEFNLNTDHFPIKATLQLI